jgi:hypothetical protein
VASLDGKRLSLAEWPVGSLDLYKPDLSLDPETTGGATRPTLPRGLAGQEMRQALLLRGYLSSTADNSEDSQEPYDAASNSDTAREDVNEDATVESSPVKGLIDGDDLLRKEMALNISQRKALGLDSLVGGPQMLIISTESSRIRS